MSLNKIDSQTFNDRYIGDFLNALRNDLGEIDHKYILNKSEYKNNNDGSFGTLENKRALAEAFAKEEFSWEVLKSNPHIEELTIEIYKFIKNK
ncbi:hypothetical protein EAG08_06990 [Chryseobacterium sp. 3008163]|nr:hypothetical protein EAG08_06990 [Chryseobacterium sp. 3008163]